MPSQVERIASMEEKLKGIDEKLTDFIKTADDKYASRLTQTIVYALCAAVLMLFFNQIAKINHSPQQTVTITTQNPNGTTTTRVVPLTGSGQVITANPNDDATPGTSAQPSAGSSQSTQPTTTPTPTPTPSNSQPAVCDVPVVGLVCKL